MTRTDPASPSPGDRVVVRFRKGAGAPGDWRRDPSATASDVTGVLVSTGADVVVARDGDEITVPAALVLSVRALSDRPVRNSDIRSLEIAAARGWPGTDFAVIDGWLARAGGGFTRRANSATPVERGATLDDTSVAALAQFFHAHDLATRCAVVERLIPASHVDPDRFEIQAVAMVRSTDPLSVTAGVDVDTSTVPAPGWVQAYLDESGRSSAGDVATAVLTASVDGMLAFFSVSDDQGLVAIGRGAVTSDEPFGADPGSGQRWVGIACLWTAPRARGTGIGSRMVAEVLRWGRDQGADNAYLQVEADNVDAIRL
ncbi:N-acetyltransferase, partial [Williamsia sp.]|uniref:GNAT family N-acetyltransferase n=1 Tax=Williamsia sp. TaxID=1872085 RepID=UPI001A2A99DD